jgi:DNA repair exonuclease SbcCD nuclease subunit
VKIAISGDLHVDDFGSKVDPGSGLNARFVDALTAARFVASTARELGAEALVIAGDYTERRTPAPPRVARIIDALKAGPDRQIHVRGNHDQERAGQSIVDVLGQVDGWSGFTSPGVELVGDVAVCVIPFLAPSYLRSQAGMETASQGDVYRALAEAYLTIARGQFVAAEALGAKAAILVGHQQLAGGRMSASQQAFLGDLDLVIDARALGSIGYAAVVFGHVHRAQILVDDPACPVLFTGSTHRVDFAEEFDEQSFVLLDVVDGRATVERIPIPARRFVTLTGDGVLGEWAEEELAAAICGSVVRVVDAPTDQVEEIRSILGTLPFEVAEIRRRPVQAPESNGGLSETLTAHEALDEYFVDDVDREVLVERGRALLAEVAA